MTSIFDDTNKLTSNWWKKDNIGDKVEGTFEGKNTQINQMSGKEQLVYQIRVADGTLYLVGGNIGIDSQMQRVKIGQIVGFEYTEERPNKKNPSLNPTKVVQVYANPSLVNEEWLAEQKRLGVTDRVTSTENTEPVTAEEAEEIINGSAKEVRTENIKEDNEAPFLTESEKKRLIVQITELATSKLGATDGEDVKNKVMNETSLAFIDSNLNAIVNALSELPERK